ncbi:MAG: hypothetical protein IJD61_03160 [Clostridia bacterium]|nr:hypothetical protein [Clostridia bacterium]
MKLIYICSPFRGDTAANTEAAQRYCRRAYEQNCIPVAPHLYLPQFLNDDEPKERDLALRIGLRLIDYCSEVWVHGDIISDGMRGEIDYATTTGKKVVYLPGADAQHKSIDELEAMRKSGDPQYWTELARAVVRDFEEYRRIEAERGPIESPVDEDAVIDDLY